MAKEDATETPVEAQTPEPRKRRMIVSLLIVLLVLAISGCGYWFWQYHKAASNAPNARQKQFVSRLDKIVVTPSEEPVITTVIDASKLTNETLAGEAQNGDQLFIFSKSHRIILYRPAANKVVDMLTIQAK